MLQDYLAFLAFLAFLEILLPSTPKAPVPVVEGGVFRGLVVHPDVLVHLAHPVSQQASVSAAVHPVHLGHQGGLAFLDFLDFLFSMTSPITTSTGHCPPEACW